MEELIKDSKEFNKNKWCYSLGGIGRDMTYTLVATFLLVYIQFTMKLTIAQFTTISILLIVGRIWDAINDPIMGAIIENTKTKWGKFKPWILIGAVITGAIIILMFNVRVFTGWSFVIFFAIIYFFWEIAFTMNDISYWSMLPSLSQDAKRRDKITTFAVVFAGVGAFAANAIIALAAGDMVKFYGLVSIGIAFALIACQSLTVFGVKESQKKIDEINSSEKNVTIKEMFKTIKNNDQLLWVTLAMFLYNIGSSLLGGALAYNMIYLELDYNGTLATILVACLGVSNIIIQMLYVKFVSKTGRNKLLMYSLFAILFGYLFLLLLGFTFIPINIVTICIFAIFVFSGQAIFYMILTISLTNTIEYNEYKTGERREAVVFSLRPFMAKFASAVTQLIVYFILVFSGIYSLTQSISTLETEKGEFESASFYETKADQEEYINNLRNYEVVFEEERQIKYAEIELMNYDDIAEKASRVADANKEIKELYDLLNDTEITYNDNTGRYEMNIKPTANLVLSDGTNTMKFILRLGLTVIPMIFILGAFFVLRKKYIIDEEMYDAMRLSIGDSIAIEDAPGKVIESSEEESDDLYEETVEAAPEEVVEETPEEVVEETPEEDETEDDGTDPVRPKYDIEDPKSKIKQKYKL